MDTIERLKKYMEENNINANEIVYSTRIPLATLTRYLKGKGRSLVYDNILDQFLTSKSY